MDLSILDRTGEVLAEAWPHGSSSLHVTRLPGRVAYSVNLHRDGECYTGYGKTMLEAFARAADECSRLHEQRRRQKLDEARALLASEREAA